MKYVMLMLLFLSACGNTITGASTGAMSTELPSQVVKVGLNSQGYTFSPSTVEVNKPVKLVRDQTLQGCAMFLVSPKLGINANLMQNSEYIFTPEQTGTFDVMCSMNMYR